MGFEKRRFPRLKAVIPIDYQIDEYTLSLFNQTLDISRSGVYLISSNNIIKGVDIDLKFALFGKNLESSMVQVPLKGHVVRTEKLDDNLLGVGIKFCDCNGEAWSILKQGIIISEKFNPLKAVEFPSNEPLDHFEQNRLIRMYTRRLAKKNAAFNSQLVEEK